MAEKVNAETDLNPKKTRKAREKKSVQPLSNYDQILAAASGLRPKEKAMLSKEMKLQAKK